MVYLVRGATALLSDMKRILIWLTTPKETPETNGWGIAIARLLTGGMLFYYHGLHKAMEGYEYFSAKTDHWGWHASSNGW